MIDVTLPPYNCQFNWTGSDATAADDGPGLQAAINDAALITGPGIDLGGVVGDVLQFPKGIAKVGQKLVFPFGVSAQGARHAYYASGLKMADNFPSNDHFIDLGDSATNLASMGCSLSDMILFSLNQGAAQNTAMVYTRNAQDTDPIVGRCRIYAGSRMAIFGEIGSGGATMVNFRNLALNGFGTKFGANPVNHLMRLNYSPACNVMLDGIQVACYATGDGPGTIGLYLVGGMFDIRRFHAEQIYTGCHINMPNDSGHAMFDHGNGNPSVRRLIAIGNTTPPGRVRVKMMNNQDSTYPTVFNDITGVHTYGNIIGEQVF